MEKSKENFNIWKYLPTWKEAKKWVLWGMIWGFLSLSLIDSEQMRRSMPSILLLPMVVSSLGAYKILSLFYDYPAEHMTLGIFINTFIWGFIGYLLRLANK